MEYKSKKSCSIWTVCPCFLPDLTKWCMQTVLTINVEMKKQLIQIFSLSQLDCLKNRVKGITGFNVNKGLCKISKLQYSPFLKYFGQPNGNIQALCYLSVCILPDSAIQPMLDMTKRIAASSSYKTKLSMLEYIQVYTNCFSLRFRRERRIVTLSSKYIFTLPLKISKYHRIDAFLTCHLYKCRVYPSLYLNH